MTDFDPTFFSLGQFYGARYKGAYGERLLMLRYGIEPKNRAGLLEALYAGGEGATRWVVWGVRPKLALRKK